MACLMLNTLQKLLENLVLMRLLLWIVRILLNRVKKLEKLGIKLLGLSLHLIRLVSHVIDHRAQISKQIKNFSLIAAII